MKKLFRIFLILCLVVAVSNYLSTRAFESSAQRYRVESTFSPRAALSAEVSVSPAPQESLDDLLNRCAEQFIAEYPDHSRAEYNPDTRVFLLSFWQDDIEDVVRQSILGLNPSLAAWSDICASVEELSLSVQREFENAGYRSVNVEIQMLNPDNKRLSLLHATHGYLIYDVVASSADSAGSSELSFASLGSSILGDAEPTFVPAPAETVVHFYVLNTNSKKFHLPSCSSAAEISATNYSTYSGTRDSLIKMGYQPCKICNP